MERRARQHGARLLQVTVTPRVHTRVEPATRRVRALMTTELETNDDADDHWIENHAEEVLAGHEPSCTRRPSRTPMPTALVTQPARGWWPPSSWRTAQAHAAIGEARVMV